MTFDSNKNSGNYIIIDFRQVLEVVAGCKGITDIEGLSKTLYHNTCRLFFPQDLDASAEAQLESGTNVQDS